MIRPASIPFGATAVRPTWTDLPAAVRREIEALAAGAVINAESQRGGYTPGFASRLLLKDGRRVFVKAASSEHPWMIEAYQTEVDKRRLLPADIPAPQVIFDRQFTAAGHDWVITGFEDIAGRPPDRPWCEEQATAVLESVVSMSRTLTPPPNCMAWPALESQFTQNAEHWADVVERRLVPEPLLEIGPALARDFLDRYPKTTLAHFDVRDDNVIIGSRIWFCDWNYPVLGPIWTDAIHLLISIHGDGLDADRMLAETGLDARDPLINGYLAVLLGAQAWSGHNPENPTSPYLRKLQRWHAEATVSWLLQRLR